jgi:hypothetical protein
MQNDLTWTISADPWGPLVALQGAINEQTDLTPLVLKLQQEPRVRLDLAGVQRITTSGIREWMHFIGPFTATKKVELVHCSPAIVAQLNIFRDFIGTALIHSFQAPYLCPVCDAQTYLELSASVSSIAPETIPCAECGAPMEFDDLPDCYFAFLRWSALVVPTETTQSDPPSS